MLSKQCLVWVSSLVQKIFNCLLELTIALYVLWPYYLKLTFNDFLMKSTWFLFYVVTPSDGYLCVFTVLFSLLIISL